MKKEASFSKDRVYRYWLKRSWDESKKSCCFICLNPSMANETTDDKMVTRCIEQATRLGFGSIEMVNLFAYVDTNRDTFYDVTDPVGSENDKYILKSARRCSKVIVAWGNEGSYRNRAEEVLTLLNPTKINLYCLGLNLSGEPSHPGRISYINELIRYKYKH